MAMAPDRAKAVSLTFHGASERLAAEASLSRTASIARPGPVRRSRYTISATITNTPRQSQ